MDLTPRGRALKKQNGRRFGDRLASTGVESATREAEGVNVKTAIDFNESSPIGT